MKINVLLVYLLFNFFSASSQEDSNNQKILNSVTEYFKFNSESIFLHFNKSEYLSNEKIWFKGYIVDRNTNSLNFETTNVYVKILDSNKNELDTKLFHAYNGVIIGNLELNDSFNSGKYYVQSYTNHMNNFEEDESSIFSINIINVNNNILTKEELTLENASIDIAVEGGNFLLDCDNTIAVSIKHCNGKGIKLNNIKVYDSKNNLVNQFSTNIHGNGIFEIVKTKNENYKIIIEEKSYKIEKKLPLVQHEGVTLSVNNYVDKKNVIIKLKTNQYTLDKIKKIKYKIAIQKNNQIVLYDTYIDDLNKNLNIDKTNLFKGINTIRILDFQNNAIAERLIYNHENDSSKIIIENHKITKDSIFFKGKLSKKMANFSLSILPEGTLSNFDNNSIVSQLNLNSYLNNVVENYSYYFKDFDRTKQFELDLVLLNESKSKYNWSSIMTKKPIISYSFDKGLNITGTINNTLSNKEKNSYSINLVSVKDGLILNETIDDKNQFNFKNIIVKDSTTLFISLMKNNKTFDENLKFYSTISNNKNKFLKIIKKNETSCKIIEYPIQHSDENNFPLNKKTILLKEVSLTEDKEEKLTYAKVSGNSFATAIKIDNGIVDRYPDFLSLIQNYGFNVTKNFGQVRIEKIISDKFGPLIPAIYFNGNVVEELSFLLSLPLSDIDEVYINKMESGLKVRGKIGSIKIYTKKDISANRRMTNSKMKTITVTDGFQKEIAFENPYFYDFQLKPFKEHGIIDWIPNIYTDIEGNFEFKIPKMDQENVLLNIQGIDSEGNYYFENFNLKMN